MPRNGRHSKSDRSARSEDGQRPRGIWSGSISFGLVTVPVELFSATRRERPSLRMLSPDGVPLAREYVCPKHRKALSVDEIVRGFEIREGKFVTVSDDELERLAPRRSRDIELTSFVDRDALDPAYFERSYFLIPGGEQTRAYRLLADTMESKNRAAIAHFVMRGKAYAVAILADRGILRAEILRFGDEVRTARELSLPKPEKTDRERVRHMQKLVGRLSEKGLDEKELRDEEPKALVELARAKQKRGKDVIEAPEVEAAETEKGAEIVDIMAIIRQRLREGKAGRTGAPAQRTARPSSSRAHAKHRRRRVSRSSRRAAARRQ